MIWFDPYLLTEKHIILYKWLGANKMEKTKMYMLFGLSGFSVAGFVGAAKQLNMNIFSLLFSASTIYYFLTLFITYAPILLLVKFMKTKSLSGVLPSLVFTSVIYSFITLGALLSLSNIEYLLGGVTNVLIGVVLVTYIATLISMKLVENIQDEDVQP